MCCLSMGIAVFDKCLQSTLLYVGDSPAPWCIYKTPPNYISFRIRCSVLSYFRMMRSKLRLHKLLHQLLPDQLVLLLEYLLEEKTLCPRTLQHLEKTYQLHDQDAEVRHRWCELVVKHKYVPGYGDIEKFLREDQAMGVYLYGELMLNEDAKQQELAFKCFAAAQEQMDMSAAKVVAEMLF
uniref:Peptidase M1 leukotriene A4 hydrolase/aminopeptidase C-terminal domain-containing protein n=1 Tax=Gallus gallus TaxID=9031 RepID=A0A8V0Y8C6_CHICK